MKRLLSAAALVGLVVFLCGPTQFARGVEPRTKRGAGDRAHVIKPAGSASAQSDAKKKPARPKDAKARSRSTPAAKHSPKRVASVVGLSREGLEQYVILHAHVWPEVLKQLRESNVRNFSIHVGELDDGNLYLFSYFEYVGDDYEADMEAMTNDPVTREWWKLTDPLQKRLRNTPPGSQWKPLEEVFHTK